MEKGKIKALNFDLDTNVMKSLGVYPDGYRQLGKALHEAGFLTRLWICIKGKTSER